MRDNYIVFITLIFWGMFFSFPATSIALSSSDEVISAENVEYCVEKEVEQNHTKSFDPERLKEATQNLKNLTPFGRTFSPQHIPLFLHYNWDTLT